MSIICGGKPGQGWRCNKWLGVSGCSSRGLSLLRVRGASAITVESTGTSSETSCSFKMAFRICHTERIIHSHTPPIWLTEGELKIYSIFFCPRKLLILCSFHISTASFSSLCAFVKLLPRSLLICSGYPQTLMNFLSTFIIESVSKEWAISMCTACVVKRLALLRAV